MLPCPLKDVSIWIVRQDNSDPSIERAVRNRIQDRLHIRARAGAENSKSEHGHGVNAPTILPRFKFNQSTNHNSLDPTQIYYNGQWTNGGIYTNAKDVSKHGIAIGKTPYQPPGSMPSILLNGKWKELSKVAPDIPASWHFPSSFDDISDKGWVILSGPTNFAAMLPIAIKGSYVADSNTIFTEGAGVDDYSIASDFSHRSEGGGDLVKNRIWISAPVGGAPRLSTWEAPLDPMAKLTISADNAKMGGLDQTVRQFPNELVDITAHDAESGTEIPIDLKLGTQAAINSPVWLYTMRERVLKVRVYRITRSYAGGSHVPDTVDTAAMAKHITDILKPQINASVTVSLAPGTVNGAYPVSWDLDGDALLAVDSVDQTSEQNLILDDTAVAADWAATGGEFHMRVFMIGNKISGLSV